MPHWAEEALKQFPIVGVVLAVAWYAFRQFAKSNEDHSKQLEDRHNSIMKTMKDLNEKHLASKEAEIARLLKDKELLQKEKDTLQKQLREAMKPQ
jgi:hypothetical protein